MYAQRVHNLERGWSLFRSALHRVCARSGPRPRGRGEGVARCEDMLKPCITLKLMTRDRFEVPPLAISRADRGQSLP